MIKNYYIEKGQGYPIIFLHGNGEDHTYFVGQFEEFSKHFHIYALDTRGHGLTSRGDKEFTIEQFSKDLLNFMNEQNIEKAHILGFSDGGNIALQFALENSDRINKLVVNGANIFPAGLKESSFQKIKEVYYKACLEKENSKEAYHTFELYDLMVNQPNIKAEDLHSITCDTLVITGEKDIVTLEHSQMISDNINNSVLKVIEGNHFVAKKNPSLFNSVVLDFLLKS